ncbi:transcriptional regulator [Clostridium carboxidivorans P7]|uniref:TfoX domain protein n=1 Tax=Clostridium carboxidivorans P7 TaxID=536227 RepID=C6PNV5_9CLOT|nr:TfoX/Sxy family protein [Clostridium carboxidivorans]AKN31287.1 transcriptional regulator [Clostridium carboxidivorans P7]EET89033.1 TfoX domain protein [Clostridium carboxidivorans P7]
MASSQEYLDFIIGQLDTLDNVSFRKMMGEYILYFRGKIFGGIYDDRFLVKITKASRRLMLEAIEELPYDGAKPMLLVENVDNKELLYQLITEMYEELPMPKAKKKK